MNRIRTTSFLIITFLLIFERNIYGDWIDENSIIDLVVLLLYIIGIALIYYDTKTQDDSKNK